MVTRLRADHSGLPATPGEPPVSDPKYALAMARAMVTHADIEHVTPAKGDVALPFRGSRLGACARDLGYELADVPETNRPTEADRWRMQLGTLVHDFFGASMIATLPGEVTVEQVVTLDGLVSFHVDLIHRHQGEVEAIEVKTMNGFSWKRCTGAQGEAEGPRTAHKLQGFGAGRAIDADRVIIIYLSMENVAKTWATKLVGANGDAAELARFAAEWRYERHQYEPVIDNELRRLRRIKAIHDDGGLPPRAPSDIPVGARIVDPSKGAWELRTVDGELVSSGKTWMCRYCRRLDQCQSDLIVEQAVAEGMTVDG